MRDDIRPDWPSIIFIAVILLFWIVTIGAAAHWWKHHRDSPTVAVRPLPADVRHALLCPPPAPNACTEPCDGVPVCR